MTPSSKPVVTVRTRIAPSPTGFPHIGTIYQVLIDYVFARKHGGQFVLRLEDTDRNRLVEGAELVIYEAMAWFGLTPDESPVVGGPYGPYRQSDRLKIYAKYAEELLASGQAYYCFCTRERLEEMRKAQEAAHQAPMYDKHCLQLSDSDVKAQLEDGVPKVIRMKVPENRKIVFEDAIVGRVEFDSSVVDHQVIMKSDGFPTYHFAVVVDDHLMQISHVFRGREWISSTPKHVLLYEYFGWEMPVHAHLPLLLNSDGKGKLSKRHGHASVDYYKTQGYLPEAVLNYLANVVWRHPEGEEIFSLEEFTRLFELSAVTSQGARFDLAKLDWVNKEYLKVMSDDELLARLVKFDEKVRGLDIAVVKKVLPLVKERMTTLSSFWSLSGFLFEKPLEFESKPDPNILKLLVVALKDTDWNHAVMEQAVRAAAESAGKKARDVFMELRLAITGKTVGPPLLESLEILGKEETLKRLESLL